MAWEPRARQTPLSTYFLTEAALLSRGRRDDVSCDTASGQGAVPNHQVTGVPRRVVTQDSRLHLFTFWKPQVGSQDVGRTVFCLLCCSSYVPSSLSQTVLLFGVLPIPVQLYLSLLMSTKTLSPNKGLPRAVHLSGCGECFPLNLPHDKALPWSGPAEASASVVEKWGSQPRLGTGLPRAGLPPHGDRMYPIPP